MDLIEIFTDGSSLGNPGPGGFAAIIKIRKKEIIVKGSEPNTTNNRMELTAAIEALKQIPKNEMKDKRIEIFSDSRLLVETMRKGWKKKENIDLWRKIAELCEGKNITWHWVKGHTDHQKNLKADEIATKEAEKAAKLNKNLISPSIQKNVFHCNRCNRAVAGKLTVMTAAGLIRADCEFCGKFIKFAKHTKEVLRRVKEKRQQELF